MPETLQPAVVDSVVNTNFKVLTDQTPAQANLALANSVAFQQGMNTLFATIVGKMAETIVTLDPAEAVGNAIVGQIGSKIAGNTPPQSNPS